MPTLPPRHDVSRTEIITCVEGGSLPTTPPSWHAGRLTLSPDAYDFVRPVTTIHRQAASRNDISCEETTHADAEAAHRGRPGRAAGRRRARRAVRVLLARRAAARRPHRVRAARRLPPRPRRHAAR